MWEDDPNNRTEAGQQVLQAKEVYVLMNDDYSISRNARSSWYLSNLNMVLPCRLKEHLSKSDDFEIISVIPTDDLVSRERSTNCYFCLAPSTIITFLAHRYRFVFILDISPSLASLDSTSSNVLIDRVFLSLRNTLKSLVKPFCTPGSTLQLRPQLYISVIVHTTVISCRMKQVLIHGCHVTQDNVDDVLSQVQKDLLKLEMSIACSITHITADRNEDESDLQRTSESSQVEICLPQEYMELQNGERCILSPDVCFVSMLRYGLLALQLLPENCTSGIVIITDGVIGFPDSSVFELLIQQMRHDMVACSFIQVGSGYEIGRSYGHVPYPELMQFMAMATFGTYFSTIPRLTETGDPAMNSVHRGLLTRGFQRLLDSHTLRSLFSSTLENEFFRDPISRELSPELSFSHLWSMPFMQKKYSDCTLQSPLSAVVACRLRDGYSIRDVNINAKNPKGESMIEIRMVLPWRDRVTILYIVKAAWPLTSSKCTTHVEVLTEATQDFFQESATFLNQPKSAHLRRMTKYWDSLKLMTQTDHKMVHFQSFNVNPANYTIPGPLCDGIPLFHHSGQAISEPQVSRQLNQRDPKIADFVNFWKQALTIDVTMWHKWMHVHRVSLILEHDIPVGKHLHTPNSSGRYTSIFCRQSLEIVLDYLRRSTSFVLMEKHSYVQLLFGQYDKVPTSFYLIRVDSKSPYVILRVAFLGGMSGKQRTQIMNELKTGVLSLRLPARGIQKQNGCKAAVAKFDLDHRQPAMERHWREMPCCVVTRKPLEKILIKYEKLPNDFNAMELIPTNEKSSIVGSTALSSRMALHAQTTLSNYLSHHRWIWSLQRGSVQLLTVQTVGKILSMLAKIRLQEGFHFASCNQGILNMAIEVDMQSDTKQTANEPCTCVIQYIIFPYHNQQKNGSAHETLLRTSVMSNCSEETLDDIEGIEPEGSGLEIVTECWVEPQHGTAVTELSQTSHFNGLDYKKLLESMFPVDLDCISLLMTFDYLGLICQNSDVPIPPMTGGSSLTVTETSNKGGMSTSNSLHLDHSIDHISFPFDLFTLLAKSQQLELLFSVYRLQNGTNKLKVSNKSEVRISSGLLFDQFLDQLQTLHDRELPLSEDDCIQFMRSIINRNRDSCLHPFPFAVKKMYTDESRESVSCNRPSNESLTNNEDQAACNSSSDVVPAWRCFVRSEDSAHLILTIVPTSCKDLTVLKARERMTSAVQGDDLVFKDDTECESKGKDVPAVDSPVSCPEKNLDLEENVRNDNDGKTDDDDGAHFSVLPIYVYNCPLNSVMEQLVNHWTYNRPADIFEDLTFEDDVCSSSFLSNKMSEGYEKGFSPRDLRDQLSFPGFEPRRSGGYEGAGVRDRWRRSADDLYKDQELLGLHRTHISDLYLRCFVTGVYDSLRVGRWVDSRDVDAAINRVCEEVGLFEVNISKFLHCSCQTMKSLVEPCAHDDPQTSFKDGSEDATQYEIRSGKMNPLFGLFENHLCEPSLGLHELLRKKFCRILSPHFKPIPNSTAFFFYSAPDDQQLNGEHFSLDEDATRIGMAEVGKSDGDLDSDIKAAGTSVTALSNLSSSDSVGDDISKLERSKSIDAASSSPLFVHLMCSVHLPSGLQSTPVQSLPMCLSELEDCISDLALLDCDISSLKVTLDFICLTLPPVDNHKGGSKRAEYMRTVSTLSEKSVATDEETDEIGKPTMTPVDLRVVKNLPKCQQQSVKACKDEILWLIEDEVISSLRLIVPVTETTLRSVVGHIENSLGRPLCLHADVPLQFVFGPGLSKVPFTEQFEKLHVQKYRLSKEGIFFYLCKDHICSNVIEGANALSSALKKLDFSSPASIDQAAVNSVAKGEAEINDVVCLPLLESGIVEYPETHVKEDSIEPDDVVDSEDKDSSKSSKDIQILVSRPSPIREIPVTKLELLSTSDMTNAGNEGEDNLPSVSEMEFVGLPLQKVSPEDHVPAVVGDDASDTELISRTERGIASVDPEDEVGNLDSKDSCDKNSITDNSPVCSAWKAESLLENSEAMIAEDLAEKSDVQHSSCAGNTDSELIQSEAKTRRVRPISGPAIYDVIRKNQATVDSFDGSRHPFHSFSQQNINRESPSNMKPLIEYSSMHCIKRAQSSLSFEKLRPDRPKLRYPSQGACSSECNTPQVDGRTLLRSRHASGLETPISAVDTSSLASTGEAGYEGDSSDPDEDGTMMSYNESISTVQRRLPIPDFWQILRVNLDKVDIYFHARDNLDNKSTRRYKEVFKSVAENIRQICHSVNQKLLLDDMYKKMYCNNLLVPEADEDIRWSRDVMSHEKSSKWRNIQNSESDSDDEESRGNRCLVANMQFGPGHFACDCVYQRDFILHPRLKMAPQRGKESPGVQALMSVLDKFVVVNRKNMYVLKDSSGDNVFYIRLSETSQEIKTLPVQQPSVDSDDYKLPAPHDVSSYSSTHMKSSRQDGEDSRSSSAAGMSDRDGDHQLNLSQSFRSSSSLSKHRTEDRVTVSVYGICPVGPDISENLIQILQKKLDEAILEIVTLTLSRNAMCKLLLEDIQFIQKPFSEPVMQLQFVIPPSVILHQFALTFYLRQNLLQFLFTPKYADGGKPENTFQDYGESTSTPIPESDVFLYVRPQQSGGKGIACIRLSLVDGKGTAIQLLGSPKVSPQAYKEPLDKSMFDGLVNTYQYRPSLSPTKSPGPTSLIQFRIWECGTLDMPQLTDMLLQAIKHAICDIILEFRLLSAPICEVPLHYEKGVDSPMHSAPASPGLGAVNTESRHNHDSSLRRTGFDIGRYVIKTPKETSSSIHSLFDVLSKSSAVEVLPSREQVKNVALTSSDFLDESRHLMMDHCNHELMKKIQRYEKGEKGNLTSAFFTCIPDWLEYCVKLGVPAVNIYQYQLASRFPIDYFLKECALIVNTICPDTTTAIFRSKESFISSNTCQDFIPYQPLRTPGKDGGYGQVTLDIVRSTIGGFPGRPYAYVMVGRNVAEWKTIMENLQDDLVYCPSSVQPTKVYRKCQKFPPLECDSEGKSNCTPGFFQSASSISFDQMEKVSVPRQRFILMILIDKQVTVYVYNWASDLASSLERQLLRQIHWQNARSHVLNCIISQKAGLFRRTLLTDLAPEKFSLEPNPFLVAPGDVDHLVKSTVVPQGHLQKIRNRSGSVASSRAVIQTALVPLVPCFDHLYRDFHPPVPINKAPYGGLRDPLHRLGAQALELRNIEKRENEKRKKLEDLYLSWQQRSSAPLHASDESLNLLKSSSRLIHYVSTPLLFNPLWLRQSFASAEAPATRRESATDAKPVSQRSRHSSGASVRSKRSDSMESTKKVMSCLSLESLNWQPTSCHWYMTLCSSFRVQYVQYLQSMSFLPVNHQPHPMSPSMQSEHDPSDRRNDCIGGTYLQKSLPGGVILIELEFRDVYFCVTVYAFESSSSCVTVGKNVSPQLNMMFTDECDKFKDLTHLHSFSHDFHVRLIQSFISGDHSIFPSCYLTSLLQELINYFPNEPNFSWNYIHDGTLVIASGATPGQQLFDYMLHCECLLLADAYPVTPIIPDDDDHRVKDGRAALVCSLPSDFHQTISPTSGDRTAQTLNFTSSDKNDFEIGLIISLNTSLTIMDTSSYNLVLHYWIIVTNGRQLFPKQNLEKKLALFSALQAKVTVATPSSFGRCLASKRSNIFRAEPLQQESVNYRGYSNIHQMAVQTMISEATTAVQIQVTDMVNKMQKLCRRDFLWKSLQKMEVVEEESRRRRKTGADDDQREKMTSSDFKDLLSLVTKTDVTEIDPTLKLVFGVPLLGYESLIRVLINKYTDHSRYLCCHSLGESIRYVVIFNPKCSDVFLLLTICDKTPGANMFIVYREPCLSLPAVSGLQKHVENVINTCCYHLWTQLIS